MFYLHMRSIIFIDYSFSYRNGQKLSSWDAPIYLKKALERRYGGMQGGYPVIFANESEHKVLRRKAKILSTMYDWLEHLAGQSNTFGALGIAEAVLFIWKEHFETNPLYEQVTRLLLFRGSEQQGWFPTAKHKLPITEERFESQNSTSEFLGRTNLGPHSPGILKANKRAVVCITNALMLEGGGETEKTHTYSQAVCDEIADLVDHQNSLVDEFVRMSTMTQLSRVLKIHKMVTQCNIVAEIIKSDNYRLGAPTDKYIYEDLENLRFHLQQLIFA